jgi:hypothetical protein
VEVASGFCCDRFHVFLSVFWTHLIHIEVPWAHEASGFSSLWVHVGIFPCFISHVCSLHASFFSSSDFLRMFGFCL